MKRIRIRRDKSIKVQRFSDKLILFFLSFFYLAYLFNAKKLQHIQPEQIIRFETFVHKFVKRRLFVIKSPINPEINLFCRSGHEMINLGVENFENNVKNSFHLNTNEVVIDIGAHLGEYSLAVAKNAEIVIAVEANPDTFKILQKNIELNKISNIIPINKAIYDSTGYQTLKIFGDKSGMSSMVMNYEDKSDSIKVKTETLDRLVDNLKLEKVDWIKIDVEGAEYNVLKGAKQTISLNKERIKLIIELHGEKNSILVKKMFSEDFQLFYEMLDNNHVFAYFR